MGDCPGPRKGAMTRRNVTRGVTPQFRASTNPPPPPTKRWPEAPLEGGGGAGWWEGGSGRGDGGEGGRAPLNSWVCSPGVIQQFTPPLAP